MLFDSVSLNVLALFFPSHNLIIKKRDEVELFIKKISEKTDAKKLLYFLSEQRYLNDEGGDFLRLSGKGADIYCSLRFLSDISIAASR